MSWSRELDVYLDQYGGDEDELESDEVDSVDDRRGEWVRGESPTGPEREVQRLSALDLNDDNDDDGLTTATEELLAADARTGRVGYGSRRDIDRWRRAQAEEEYDDDLFQMRTPPVYPAAPPPPSMPLPPLLATPPRPPTASRSPRSPSLVSAITAYNAGLYYCTPGQRRPRPTVDAHAPPLATPTTPALAADVSALVGLLRAALAPAPVETHSTARPQRPSSSSHLPATHLSPLLHAVKSLRVAVESPPSSLTSAAATSPPGAATAHETASETPSSNLGDSFSLSTESSPRFNGSDIDASLSRSMAHLHRLKEIQRNL